MHNTSLFCLLARLSNTSVMFKAASAFQRQISARGWCSPSSCAFMTRTLCSVSALHSTTYFARLKLIRHRSVFLSASDPKPLRLPTANQVAQELCNGYGVVYFLFSNFRPPWNQTLSCSLGSWLCPRCPFPHGDRAQAQCAHLKEMQR